MRPGRLAWGGAALLGAVGVAFFFVRPAADRVSCGRGFVAVRARCVTAQVCAPLLVVADGRCAVPRRVEVPRTRLTVGPSDWEAEGRVTPRTLEAGPLW